MRMSENAVALAPNSPLPKHVPIAHTTRGGYVENVFYGSVAVVDRNGKLIASAGDVQTPIFTRSALKPFQALPLVAHPKFADYKLSAAETALLCASHNGEDMHAEAAKAMLSRIGLTDAALLCGTHAPYWYSANDKRPEEGRRWNAYFHNCSGKHSGMLLYAALNAADKAHYLDTDHVVQMAIRDAVAYACGVADTASMPWGTDGCSAPNYAVSLAGLARAFAWMTRDDADAKFGDAGQRLFHAMATHPEMISGEGRNDLALAKAGRGDWIAKIGAEGVQTLASKHRGIGIAMKNSSGNQASANPTALMVAFCSVLAQLNLLDDFATAALRSWFNPVITSIRGVEVGRYEPNVTLRIA